MYLQAKDVDAKVSERMIDNGMGAQAGGQSMCANTIRVVKRTHDNKTTTKSTHFHSVQCTVQRLQCSAVSRILYFIYIYHAVQIRDDGGTTNVKRPIEWSV